jgi:hypothetical protein
MIERDVGAARTDGLDKILGRLNLDLIGGEVRWKSGLDAESPVQRVVMGPGAAEPVCDDSEASLPNITYNALVGNTGNGLRTSEVS